LVLPGVGTSVHSQVTIGPFEELRIATRLVREVMEMKKLGLRMRREEAGQDLIKYRAVAGPNRQRELAPAFAYAGPLNRK
jgi:hypothetical protein